MTKPPPLPPNKGKTKTLFKATFSYSPVNKDEIAIETGDIIEFLSNLEDGWATGLNQRTNLSGLYPTNFVEPYEYKPVKVSKPTPSPSTAMLSSKFLFECKVKFPYKSTMPDELDLEPDQIIRVTKDEGIDDGWWQGEIFGGKDNGKSGVFPNNFVEKIKPTSQSMKVHKVEMREKHSENKPRPLTEFGNVETLEKVEKRVKGPRRAPGGRAAKINTFKGDYMDDLFDEQEKADDVEDSSGLEPTASVREHKKPVGGVGFPGMMPGLASELQGKFKKSVDRVNMVNKLELQRSEAAKKDSELDESPQLNRGKTVKERMKNFNQTKPLETTEKPFTANFGSSRKSFAAKASTPEIEKKDIRISSPFTEKVSSEKESYERPSYEKFPIEPKIEKPSCEALPMTKKEPVTPVSLNTSSNADSSFEHTKIQREAKSIPEGIIPLPELSKSHRALIEENKEMREQMRRMQKQIDDLSKRMRRFEKMNI